MSDTCNHSCRDSKRLHGCVLVEHRRDTRPTITTDKLFLVLMRGEFAGDDLLHLLCHSIVCSVVTVSPMADGGLQTGCLSS